MQSPSLHTQAPDTASEGPQDAPNPIVQQFQQQSLKAAVTPTLDPTKHLSQWEQGLKDSVAQEGPASTDDNTVKQYFLGPNVKKTNEEIVTEQYGQKAMALDSAQQMLDQHISQTSTEQEHAGILAHIDGAGVRSDIGAGTNPNPVKTPGIDSPEYQQTSGQLESEIQGGPQEPTPHDLEAPNQSQMILAILLGLAHPGAIPQIAQSMFQTADQRRKYLDSVDAAHFKTQEVGHQKVVAALNQRLRTIGQRDAANQRAMVSTQNNQNTVQGGITKNANTEAHKDSREERALKVRQDIADMNADIKKRLADLKDPVEKVKAFIGMGYEPDMARSLANADEFNKIASADKSKAQTAGITLDNTYKARTLSTRISQAEEKLKDMKAARSYTETRTRYTNELIKYIPQNEAFKWASLLALINYRDKSLELQGERLDESTDKATLHAVESGYDKAEENVSAIQDQLDHGIDAKGNAFNSGDPNDATTKALTNQKTLYESIRDRAKEHLDSSVQAAQIKKNVRGTPWQGIKGKLSSGKSKGNRPPPMGGNVPVDPTAQGFTRTPEGDVMDKVKKAMDATERALGGKPHALLQDNPFA